MSATSTSDSGADFAGPPGGGAASALSRKTLLLGFPLSAVIAAAVLLLVLLFLAVAAAAFLRRRRRRRRRPSRVDHAASDLLPTTTTTTTNTIISKPAAADTEVAKSSPAESSSSAMASPAVRKKGRMGEVVGWGRWYEMAELEEATEGFKAENVIGEGGYGIVYRGVLAGGAVVAVKDLFDNKGQAEREFKVEVEAIGKVRHKNLVGLVGYCAEGPKRMLVYEYVENGNLEQWLHGNVGHVSPLTWDIRMKLAIGTAKGIAYLHEGLEPKVVHRDIKSSNILLDKHWNPRVSDFGMAKLLGPGSSYVTTRVMGTFGYVAPEYACTGMLNESSDIYSFGVLLMEIISGRSPVDYNRPAGEVNLVEWFKGMVGSRRIETLVDPLIQVPPSPRVLNRVLLVCLRCIDSDAQKRPKMGQIVHMLEGDEFPFRTEHRSPRATSRTTSRTASNAHLNRVSLLSENVGLDDSEKSLWR